jgi:hypothetical protein
VRDQVSHPYNTTGKTIVLDILICIFLDNTLEDKTFCTEWQQAFLDLNLLLISSWIEFWFLTVVPKYLNCFYTEYKNCLFPRTPEPIPAPELILWPHTQWAIPCPVIWPHVFQCVTVICQPQTTQSATYEDWQLNNYLTERTVRSTEHQTETEAQHSMFVLCITIMSNCACTDAHNITFTPM